LEEGKEKNMSCEKDKKQLKGKQETKEDRGIRRCRKVKDYVNVATTEELMF